MQDTKKNYTVADIKIRVVTDAKSSVTYLIFTALMETQFYSPGIKIISDEKDNLVIEFIRTNIQDKNPKFDLRADFLASWIKSATVSDSVKDQIINQSTLAEQIIRLKKSYENIYVFDGVTKNLVWSQNK